jgi:hypothetical protein
MTVDLDTRLRSAGDSLVRASERLSPAVPPRSLRPVAAVVAGVVTVVALAAGSVAVLASGGDEGSVDQTVTGPSVPRLIPDAIPEGLRPAGVIELSTAGAGSPTQSISVYGDPAADDPFAGSDLAILTTTVPLVPELQSVEGAQPVDVRGHDGLVQAVLPFAPAVLWEEAEGLTIAVASRTLDVDQLVAVAEGLEVNADTRAVDLGSLPGDLPGPLAPVASADLDEVFFGIQSVGLPAQDSTAGHLVGYLPENYDNFFANASVAELTGDATDLAVLRWVSGATTATQVRGHRAWSGSHELPGFDDGEGIVPGSQGPISAFVWEEAPGVLVLVQTFGPTEDEALALAESLRPATGDEWARMLRLGESGDRFPSYEDRLAAGQLAQDDGPDIEQPMNAVNGSEGVYGDAGEWSTWLLPDGTICGAVGENGGAVVDGYLVDTAETCDSTGGPATVVHDSDGEPVLLIGVMPDGAIGRVPVGGEIVEIQTCTGPQDASAYYIMVIADGNVPSAVTFVAADGTDMATVQVDP